MARLRQTSSRSKSPERNSGARYQTSYLDPPSPRLAGKVEYPPDPHPGQRLELPPLSPEEEAQSPFTSFLGFWSNRSTATLPKEPPRPSKPGQSGSETASEQALKLSVPEHDTVSRSAKFPRLPRHVPIVIPDFANPYAHELKSATSRERLAQQSSESVWRPGHEVFTRGNRLGLPPLAPVLEAGCTDPMTNVPSRPEMSSSQVSLGSEAGADGASNVQSAPAPATAANVGISPVQQQSSGPTHLSGLVCSVHRTTGQKPHALVGATTTILGDKLYVFGGRVHSRSKPQLTSDLFELDLTKRHWKRLDTLGDTPPPRYFHSVCALGDSKLVCYGGMSPAPRNSAGSQSMKQGSDPQPEVVVMSDIHIFDVPSRTWTLISTTENNPQGRYAHCAAILPSSGVFTSADAPLSAIHHNPSSSNPHSGTLGVQLDGTGGAEMVVVGGQDSANNYIEQINVFNLRSLKWTETTAWDRKCGAYKSMVVPMPGLSADLIGQGVPVDAPRLHQNQPVGTPMLIYSNYNFLDVKLELQIRMPDGRLEEKPMAGPVSPPGLRFPNGGILDKHFVVSGTYLTSSKHEYALWALDLKSLTWGRIDTNVSIFEQGSWNRGVLWNRRNTFVILGHRERSLVDDYNHRRINFSHVCMVELEAFGLYDNPRATAPTSGYASVSAPPIPPSAPAGTMTQNAGGRPYTSTAEQLGQAALSLTELSDMELVAIGGERIPCNSCILAKRWGPYFNHLLAESATTSDGATLLSDAATLRPMMQSQASRNSTVTITPGLANGVGSSAGSQAGEPLLDPQRSMSRSTNRTLVDASNPTSIPATSRPRSLYLPHMAQTIQLLLQFLYTSALPPVGAALCTPHTLCSLLQMARPYQIDGLLEATVERLHEVLDGRNAAAVFNAAAMAAGGGRALGPLTPANFRAFARRESEATAVGDSAGLQALTAKAAAPRVTVNGPEKKGHRKSDSQDSGSTNTSASASTDVSYTDTESTNESSVSSVSKREKELREIWTGDISSVIGLQKRGLRGLMEGRRLRERANTIGSAEA